MRNICRSLFWIGELGHFMAECLSHYPSTLEVPNEGNGKEGVERDVGVSDIVVVMYERTSSRIGDKEPSLQGSLHKNKGTQSMGTENQSVELESKIHKWDMLKRTDKVRKQQDHNAHSFTWKP